MASRTLQVGGGANDSLAPLIRSSVVVSSWPQNLFQAAPLTRSLRSKES
jgi:hypothetical protein